MGGDFLDDEEGGKSFYTQVASARYKAKKKASKSGKVKNLNPKGLTEVDLIAELRRRWPDTSDSGKKVEKFTPGSYKAPKYEQGTKEGFGKVALDKDKRKTSEGSAKAYVSRTGVR